MRIADYLKRTDTITPEELRDFLNSHDPDEYNLVDVRQPREYEREHIAGARLIPVSELPERTRELDPNKPTVTY